MSHTLIVLPDDSSELLIGAMQKAMRSLDIKMFVFRHRGMFEAVLAAHRRGVKIRVMLNPARRDGAQENEQTRQQLNHHGIEVKDSNPAFDVTHEKSLVVDKEQGFVQSFNWDEESFSCARDYGVVTSHQEEVDEISACFEADWRRQSFSSSTDSLLWCVGNARARLAELIDRTRHTLWLESERIQDPIIIEHLVRCACRGVQVHIITRPLHKLKPGKIAEAVGGLRILADVGVKVRSLHHMKLHGKMMLSDDRRAVIGSINLAPGSFDSRRELGIAVSSRHILDRLQHILHSDWEHSRKVDLSDEGLLEELGSCAPQVEAELGLRRG